MRRTQKQFRPVRRFETLERRAMLAGNVGAQQLTGFLLITGDDASNAIQITQVDPTTFKVTGLGTKVNGSNSPQIITGVTGGIGIQMLGGNDVVTLKNISTGSIEATLGTGNDTLVATGVNTNFITEFEGEDGNNSIVIDNCNGWFRGDTVSALPSWRMLVLEGMCHWA